MDDCYQVLPFDVTDVSRTTRIAIFSAGVLAKPLQA